MNWANWLMQFEIMGEVALAMLLGGVIGFERESLTNRRAFARKCWWPEPRHC